jgi:hypothetical protein
MRWVVVISVVLATTFSGVTARTATAAASLAPARAVRAPVDLAETVFRFGDALDAVNYEASFEPDARNLDRLTAACRSVFARQPTFESALQTATKAEDIAHDLVANAQPTIELCFAPLSVDEDAAVRAAEAFADFRERAFDFAAAIGK